MINILFSRLCILTCGTLYPGYKSFKTVRAKIAEDYVIWMMYWIIFAIFTATENFTDIFLSWFPFYYEAKVALILWLLPTMGNGSSLVYKNCIHPLLKKHETRVDQHLEEVREKGQQLVLHYIKETVMYIAKSAMDVINRTFPGGIMTVLDNTVSGRGIQEPVSNIIIEEIEEQEMMPTVASKVKNHKSTAKCSTKSNGVVEAETSRSNSRKTRSSKTD